MVSGPGVTPGVTAIVVTYDAVLWVERCLASLRGSSVVVVDNGSSDGTVELVRSNFPDVTLIEAENDGLAAGWNRGISESDSRYVLLLNADAWLVGDALDRIVAFADANPWAAVI